MLFYVVTESVHFSNPDRQYLDTRNGTVRCTSPLKTDAWQKIYRIVTAPLFRPYENYRKRTPNGMVIDVPDYLHAEWRIHEWNPDLKEEQNIWRIR